MSDTETTPDGPVAHETTTAEVEMPDTETPAAQNDSDADETTNETPHREAAKYRRKLRDLENEVAAEREAWTVERGLLAARVELMQRGEAERIAAGLLADPADLWRDGTELENLLDAEGNLDHAKIAATVENLAKAHPHWLRRGRTPGLDGQRSGAGTFPVLQTQTWRMALNNPD